VRKRSTDRPSDRATKNGDANTGVQNVTAAINADKANSILFMTTKVLDASRTDELPDGPDLSPQRSEYRDTNL
jgi:hypothetical protein